jgi:hypothetical protein
MVGAGYLGPCEWLRTRQEPPERIEAFVEGMRQGIGEILSVLELQGVMEVSR